MVVDFIPKTRVYYKEWPKEVGKLKVAVHLVIIISLIVLTWLLYGQGLGAIPFLLAAAYLFAVTWKEFKQYRRKKRVL